MDFPLDALSYEDKTLISKYILEYANNSYHSRNIDLPFILRFWNQEKMDLFNMFGKELILSKQVSFQISERDLGRAMDKMVSKDEFCSSYFSAVRKIFNDNFDLWNRLQRLALPSVLVNNRYDFGDAILPADYTVNNKAVKIQEGCRPIRTLHKLCQALGLNEELFEKFRWKHSQILNTRDITGELCISIHPLDYMTMSDNDSGWDSCMSWFLAYDGDGGEYRLGTIEMMNSPCVLVAYLKNADDMKFGCGNMWNNKRWRQLVIVDKDIIVGNRQYPYIDNSLEGTVLAWVRELAQSYYKTSYSDQYTDFRNFHDVSLTTDYMYNDVYGHPTEGRVGYVNTEFSSRKYLNYSGVAECMMCGDVISPSESAATDTVVCASCGGYSQCSCCGAWIDEDSDNYMWVNNEIYCTACAENELSWCPCCESYSHYSRVDSRSITCQGIVLDDWDIDMCDDCFEEYKDSSGENVDIDNLSMWQTSEINTPSSQYSLATKLWNSDPNSSERMSLISTINIDF